MLHFFIFLFYSDIVNINIILAQMLGQMPLDKFKYFFVKITFYFLYYFICILFFTILFFCKSFFFIFLAQLVDNKKVTDLFLFWELIYG